MYITLILHNDGHQKAQGIKETDQAGVRGVSKIYVRDSNVGYIQNSNWGRLSPVPVETIIRLRSSKVSGELIWGSESPRSVGQTSSEDLLRSSKTP
jgi:hypothetical protein